MHIIRGANRKLLVIFVGMKRIILKLTALAVAAVTLVSGCDCSRIDPDKKGYDHVVILYSAGFNSLSGYLKDDINDLKEGFLPGKKNKDALVVVSHLNSGGNDYITAVPPVIINIYNGSKGPVMDTVKIYGSEVCLTKASEMKEILNDVKELFPSEHYGMVFSSHSTGWLPMGYYSHPENYDFKSPDGKALTARPRLDAPEGAVPYDFADENEFPGMPPVKSIGMTNRKISGQDYSYEMNLPDFASNIPFHLDYLLFDACLTGGIEVAYELKDLCDIMCFSQAEVLAEGFNYLTLASDLLEHNGDVISVAEDFYVNYAEKTHAIERSATISVIDCTGLDGLAAVCGNLFEKYRTGIGSIRADDVQRYYRGKHHWFYDLEDILVKAGIDAAEQKQLTDALDECVMYNEATDEFLGDFKIEHHCGFSMYLPCNGSAYLDNFYKTLEWNKATKLVD